MIDPKIKRALGQMVKGVQVVGAAHDGVVRAYTSHWVSQVAFEEPIVMASVSPKHDTYPLIDASGVFTVSILAADQIDAGQYFSYPGGGSTTSPASSSRTSTASRSCATAWPGCAATSSTAHGCATTSCSSPRSPPTATAV